MDKNSIKNYAVWARRELISRVSQRATQFAVTVDGYGDQNASSANGSVLSEEERKQRIALIEQIKNKGYEQVMEEVAYTWFNRFVALRFMEVNGYLPTRIRIFTDSDNRFKPEILTEAISIELDCVDRSKVYDLKVLNDNEALFKYLLIAQCNALSSILPGMFRRISDYTELLLPDNLLREGSVIEQMIVMIPEEDWTDQVQIIGWLYQYYNTEPKEKVFADLKKNIKISKEKIPAATQLFTPDWIVRYMVENSLGRLWLEGHPNDDLKAEWKYYLDEAEQEVEVQEQLGAIREKYTRLKPEEIRCIDPCQGSGHVLACMFDILIQIYETYGYSAGEAAVSIVENNIWGLDIDERATQLAYFSIMMKARQYDRRFFSRGIQPHIYSTVESNNLDPMCIKYFVDNRKELKSAIDILLQEMYDAKELGSIINVTRVNFDALYARLDEIQNEERKGIYSYQSIDTLLPFIQVAQAMSQKYHVVSTNPPYMGASGMNPRLNNYIKKNYKESKTDLFAVFMVHGFDMLLPMGFEAMITMESWMFLSSFEKMRSGLVQNKTITTLVHMPYLGKGGTSLGINFGTEMAIIRNCYVRGYIGTYDRISHYETDDEGIPFVFPTLNEYYKHTNQENFQKIPRTLVAYWLSDSLLDVFDKGIKLGNLGRTSKGLITGDNDKFLRFWWEIGFDDICFDANGFDDRKVEDSKWFPLNKGGAYRKWYGNEEYIIKWINGGNNIAVHAKKTGHHFQNYDKSLWFKEYISWSDFTSGNPSFRIKKNDLSDHCGMSFFPTDNNNLYYLALLNSAVGTIVFDVLSPTFHLNIGELERFPVCNEPIDEVTSLSRKCVEISKVDWDSTERSNGFLKHPLIVDSCSIEIAYEKWVSTCLARREKLEAYEYRINELLLQKYNLQDVIDPTVDVGGLALLNPNLKSEIKSFISYAVGCMFGRFSLETEGIVYTGGEWKGSQYYSFLPDKDAIIPICDDEYFNDDIVVLFVEFVKTVYGKDTLEENLRFIADAIGGKGSSREVIRNYFINDFYKDHCKTYQKRPFYWMFDSGKKNGFKCLIYMHRYQPDTIARIRTDYVHEQQSRYRTVLEDLERKISDASTSDRVKLNKKLTKIQAQVEELRTYEEKIHHLADQMIQIDLDDGVKHNYALFQDVLAKIK